MSVVVLGSVQPHQVDYVIIFFSSYICYSFCLLLKLYGLTEVDQIQIKFAFKMFYPMLCVITLSSNDEFSFHTILYNVVKNLSILIMSLLPLRITYHI